MSIYTDNGYNSRKEYLSALASKYCIDITIIRTMAAILGSNEDFDGLITSIQDFLDREDMRDRIG